MASRVLDVVVATVALALLAPVLAVIAVAIRIDSKGPVIFRQQRVGRGRDTFILLKFRTMRWRDPATIDQASEPILTAGRDPRVTRVGRQLRKWSLDELPQLVNVLRGDMSLVGPRPVMPEQLRAIPTQYRVRFDVRPGITGLAQVNGRRGLGWLEKLEYDRRYVRDSSLKLDLEVLLRTVGVVLTGRGVYGSHADNWRQFTDDYGD